MRPACGRLERARGRVTETAVELCSLTLQVPRSLVARLNVLAEKSGRSASMFASEALLQYLEQAETEVEAVLEAIEELDSGAPGIPHEELVAWLRTWGTANERPPSR